MATTPLRHTDGQDGVQDPSPTAQDDAAPKREDDARVPDGIHCNTSPNERPRIAIRSTPLYRFIVLLLAVLLSQSCKKELIYTYEVDQVEVQQPGAVKPNVKSDLEVLSIAYSDLFGTSIPADELEALSLSYQSFGDKRLVMDMVILNFLNDPGAQVPTDAAMRANIESFVEDCYKKFFVREPSAFEKWFVSDMIRKDASLTPDVVYYGFMTSTEYRFY